MNKTKFIIILIFILAIFLRIYDLPNRWHFSQDESRDAAIGLEAVIQHEVPLIGSFSSAGPFVFGPIFYWLISISHIVFFFTPTAPWLTTLISSIIFIAIIGLIAKNIGGNKLAIIALLITSTSNQMILRSSALTQHTYVAISTALLILFTYLYSKSKKPIYPFLMGISLGLAISFHYQALNLVIFFAVLIFINWKMLPIMFIGFLIPSLPLLIWDSNQNFANLRNIADYFLIGQNRFYVPSSWKLFIFSFLPNYFSLVVGGNLVFGTTIMIGTISISLTESIKKNWLTITFLLLLILNRYYKGERFEGYLLYIAPFILIICSLLLYRILKINNKIGILCLFTVIIFNLLTVFPKISNQTNDWKNTTNIVKLLKEKYPNTKIIVYDRNLENTGISQGIGYMLAFEKNYPNSHKIGICKGCESEYPLIIKNGDYSIVDQVDANNNWHMVTASGMYDDLIGWSQRSKLQSSFDPVKYIYDRLP